MTVCGHRAKPGQSLPDDRKRPLAEAYKHQAEHARRSIAALPRWMRETAVPPRKRS